MDITRRNFIKSAAISAFPFPVLGCSDWHEKKTTKIDMGWHLREDGRSKEDMARDIVSAMDRNIGWYRVEGWGIKPHWKIYSKNGKTVYRLQCSVRVECDQTGRPIRA